MVKVIWAVLHYTDDQKSLVIKYEKLDQSLSYLNIELFLLLNFGLIQQENINLFYFSSYWNRNFIYPTYREFIPNTFLKKEKKAIFRLFLMIIVLSFKLYLHIYKPLFQTF